MADKIKDAEDEFLDSLFQAEAIADNGFSKRVVGRINRRLWARRITLPVAFLLGGAIAFEPARALWNVAAQMLSSVSGELLNASASWLPSFPMIVAGAALLAVTMLGLRMLEDY